MVKIAVVLVVLAGCSYSAKFDDCAVTCSEGCPRGFTCGSEGLCRVKGAVGLCSERPDSSIVDARLGVDAVFDASVFDASAFDASASDAPNAGDAPSVSDASGDAPSMPDGRPVDAAGTDAPVTSFDARPADAQPADAPSVDAPVVVDAPAVMDARPPDAAPPTWDGLYEVSGGYCNLTPIQIRITGLDGRVDGGPPGAAEYISSNMYYSGAYHLTGVRVTAPGTISFDMTSWKYSVDTVYVYGWTATRQVDDTLTGSVSSRTDYGCTDTVTLTKLP